MKRTLWTVAMMCVWVSVSVPALGAKKKPAEPPVPPKEEAPLFPSAPPRASTTIASFSDDVPALTTQLDLDEKQVAKISALRKRRDEALAKQDQADQKLLEAAQARVNQAKGDSDRKRRTQDLAKSTQRIEQALIALAVRHERTMFSVLTPAQKVKWNAPILLGEVEKLFESLDLTDPQKTQVRALCDAQVKRLSVPVSPQTAGYTIKALAGKVNLQVLTREQRQQYAKNRAVRSGAPSPRE